jgi:hypothetical protein
MPIFRLLRALSSERGGGFCSLPPRTISSLRGSRRSDDAAQLARLTCLPEDLDGILSHMYLPNRKTKELVDPLHLAPARRRARQAKREGQLHRQVMLP